MSDDLLNDLKLMQKMHGLMTTTLVDNKTLIGFFLHSGKTITTRFEEINFSQMAKERRLFIDGHSIELRSIKILGIEFNPELKEECSLEDFIETTSPMIIPEFFEEDPSMMETTKHPTIKL